MQSLAVLTGRFVEVLFKTAFCEDIPQLQQIELLTLTFLNVCKMGALNLHVLPAL